MFDSDLREKDAPPLSSRPVSLRNNQAMNSRLYFFGRGTPRTRKNRQLYLQVLQVRRLKARKPGITGCRRHSAFGNHAGKRLDRSNAADASAQASAAMQGDKRPASRCQIARWRSNFGRGAMSQRGLDSLPGDMQK